MNAQQSVMFLVVASLFTIIFAGDKVLLQEEMSPRLLSFMARTSDLTERNPSRSTDCFEYYIPLIDEIAKSYQRQHDFCLETSRDVRSQAEIATLEKRNILAATSNHSCEVLSKCGEVESAEQAFECYIAGGSENTKTMYIVNANATEHLSDLQEQFRLVETREYKCTNETKRQYEKDSTKAYDDFNKCILGIIDVPVPTQAPIPTESTKKPEVSETTGNSVNTEAAIKPENPETFEDSEELLSPESRKAFKSPIKRTISHIYKY